MVNLILVIALAADVVIALGLAAIVYVNLRDEPEHDRGGTVLASALLIGLLVTAGATAAAAIRLA